MKGSSYDSIRAALRTMRWLERPLDWCSRNLSPASMLHGREVVYQNIVHRELARLGIERPLYAVGGAANYSYLYLLLRVCTELPVQRVLELGVGQSTLLLDALAERQGFEVLGLEHDADWAERIGRQCTRARVLEAPLQAVEVEGHRCQTYRAAEVDGRFDLVLVDGPRGSRRRSRWGALEWIAQRRADDFLLIFDDAERGGEIDTIEACLKLLDRQGQAYAVGRVRGAKSQFLIAAGRMQAAVHF